MTHTESIEPTCCLSSCSRRVYCHFPLNPELLPPLVLIKRRVLPVRRAAIIQSDAQKLLENADLMMVRAVQGGSHTVPTTAVLHPTKTWTRFRLSVPVSVPLVGTLVVPL